MPDGRYEVAVKVFKDVSENEATAGISGIGAELLTPIDEHIYHAAIAPESIYTLASLDIVEWVEPIAPPYQITNIVSAQRIHVKDLYSLPYELNGKEVVVGIWDQGPAYAHNDYASRLSIMNSGTVSNHSTHVAGTIAGSGSGNPNAKRDGVTVHPSAPMTGTRIFRKCGQELMPESGYPIIPTVS